MIQPIRLRALLWAVGALFAFSAAHAQNTSSSLSGHVVEPDGSAVAGATVEILHVPSGTAKTAITDANGRYSALGLRVGGPFYVSVEKDGNLGEQRDVYLKLAEDTTLNITLASQVQTLEGVVVAASALNEVFQPDNKGLSTNISGRELQNTPSSRSIQDIARLDPRITVTDRGDGSISALGQNSRYNAISVDSVNIGDPFGLNSNGMPYIGSPVSTDTIEEYNLSTANFDVTSNVVGASINAVTKSGTNEFHGSAYYAYRNADKLTGKLDGDKYTGYDHDWTAGLTLGGPIIKDTLFFFLSYEEEKTSGIGADSANALDPSLGDGASTANGVSPGDLNRIIDIANQLGLTPGTFSGSGTVLTDKRLLTKIDWNISDNHRASLAYQRTKEVQPIVQGNSATSVGLSSYWYTKNSDTKNLSLHLYDDWTNNFSTEASLSYAKFDQVRTVDTQQPQVFVNLGVDEDGEPNGRTPDVDLGEDQYSHYNVVGTKTSRVFFAGNYTLGDHSIKGGVDYSKNDIYNLFGRTQFGAYTFWGLDNFANAIYNQYDIYQPAPGFTLADVAADWTFKQTDLFLQDIWQVNYSLSLQYGVRFAMPATNDKPIYNPAFDEAFGYRNDNTIDGQNLLMPRLSFNYDFGTERMTQLRGGVGLFQSVPPVVWMTNPYQNNGITTANYTCRPFDSNTACTDPPAFSPDPFNQNLPPPGNNQANVDTIAPNFEMPSAWKYSLALDRELPWWNLVFSAQYQHLQTKNGIWYQNLNIGDPTGTLPDGRNTYYQNPTGTDRDNRARANSDPDFGVVTYLRNTHRGHGDALTLSLSKPFANNWSGNVAATFGGSTEVNPGTSSQATSNFSNRAWVNPNDNVASPSNYSIRQRLNASLTWQHNFFADYATAITGFYNGQTGTPYSWTFGNDANGDSYRGSDLVYIPRPGDVNFAEGTQQRAIDGFYDYIQGDYYLRRHAGTIAGRNETRSAWVNQIDMSFRQEVPGLFPSGAKGEFRVDLFNVLNLLNSDWGQQSYVDFPYNRTLANYAGVGADGRYIYSLPTDAAGNYDPEHKIVYDAGRNTKTNVVSRWSVMLTLRYSF